MEISRAKEILQAEEKIQVEHHGVPVWIEDVEEATNSVRVHPENNPQDSKTVPVEQLVEQPGS